MLRGRTEAACLVDDESGEQRADRIAEARHEPDDRIEPDAIAARQRDRVVEQPGERAQAAQPLRGVRGVCGEMSVAVFMYSMSA
jgi:hypothetical protein